MHCSRVFEVVSRAFSATNDERLRRKYRHDFSRGGPLTPELLTTLLLYMVADGNRRGYRRLLENFWDEARSQGLRLPTEEPVAASSFCNARPKVTPELLKHLLQEIAASELACDSLPEHRWLGRKVFGIDGSKVNLQPDPDLMARFGTSADGHYPQATLSVLYDLGAGLPLDLEVGPFATSERDHLFEMLPSLEPGDVLVADRGYPSHEVFHALTEGGIDFLVRVQNSNNYGAVDALVASGEEEIVFVLEPPHMAPEDWDPLELRLLRIPGPDGEDAFYFTSLMAEECSRAQLAELYHMRWRIEEFFKLLKGDYIGQGQFRSKSPTGVVQELHAMVLFLAIARLCMAVAAIATGCEQAFLSQKAAVLATGAYIARLLVRPHLGQVLRELHYLLLRIARAREAPRPGRHYPRRSLKPLPKWTRKGRRGR